MWLRAGKYLSALVSDLASRRGLPGDHTACGSMPVSADEGDLIDTVFGGAAS
jgi:hypothetical protein